MLSDFFDVDKRLCKLSEEAEKECSESFEKIRLTAEYNGQKVLASFINNRISESCLKGTTGYGYDDLGREKIDAVFANAFGAEDALVRHTFVNGTHALSTALFGVLRTGDKLLALTGKPYDTLEEVIGISGEKGNGSLRDFGILYDQIDLIDDKYPDFDEIEKKAATANVAYIQRSRGYSLRPSLTVSQIGEMAAAAKRGNPNIIVMVDNCYGEFVERQEPLQVNADLIIGSLIKNPGGAIASTGGYIAGKARLVELCAYRLTCVGMGKEVGCSLNMNREILMGFFFAPEVVKNALMTSVFACCFFNKLGYEAFPKFNEPRTDIIASILLNNEENLTAFCQGIQKGAPVDSFATPEAWAMPGYTSKVIMAAGAFTMGASIELSADAPIREPFAAWLQGGITYPSGKTGVILAANEMLSKGLIKL